MKINARGTFLGCKYAIAQMMKQDLHPSGVLSRNQQNVS